MSCSNVIFIVISSSSSLRSAWLLLFRCFFPSNLSQPMILPVSPLHVHCNADMRFDKDVCDLMVSINPTEGLCVSRPLLGLQDSIGKIARLHCPSTVGANVGCLHKPFVQKSCVRFSLSNLVSCCKTASVVIVVCYLCTSSREPVWICPIWWFISISACLVAGIGLQV
jgi:hypothetical protein